MRSARPKPLHLICGRAMVLHVIHALERLRPRAHRPRRRPRRRAGHQEGPGARPGLGQRRVRRAGRRSAAPATPPPTGMSAFPGDDLDDDSTVVVLPGDTPLLQPETLDELVATHVANGSAATLLTSVLDDPTGYGRVIRAPDGRVLRIVEQRDASPDELGESARSARASTPSAATCSGRRCATSRRTTPRASSTSPTSSACSAGWATASARVQAPAEETQGVNDRWQLALAERELRSRTNRRWLLNGVTMLDPRQTFIDVTVRLGRDVTLYPGTILEGNTVVGDGCEIGPDTRLDDCVVGRDCRVQHTVGVEAEIGDRARGRPVRPPAGRVARRQGRGDRRLLHCAQRLTNARGDADGEGHDQEAGAVLGAHPSRAGRRRSPSTSASSSATRTSSSSPTARSRRASPRASAATTCSSCRATTASTAGRSTTRSWSS